MNFHDTRIQPDDTLPISEPVLIEHVFATDLNVDGSEEFVRLVATIECAEEGRPERRIVSRLVIPSSSARRLAMQLRRHFDRRAPQ